MKNLKLFEEFVNEKKGDDADISDFLGKGRQPTRDYKLIAKDGKYTLEYDERSGSIRLLYNGKQISDGWYNYTTGVGIDMEHPSWRVKNNYEKNFNTKEDIFKYFKSNKITTENVVTESVNEKAITISASDMDTLHKNGTVMVGDVELAFASGQNEKKVNELLDDAYEMALAEVKTYEGDDNSTHTIESYMKEMAALTAEKMYEMYEGACNEMREGLTAEMYESACNEMKESYASKMDEMLKNSK